MCKSHGIGFDVRDNSGTFFVLYQTEVRNKIGMMLVLSIQNCFHNF